MKYELKPVDGRKSFYGKAVVEISSDGTETLYSYQTPVMRRKGSELTRLWSGYSTTTGRHVAAFCGIKKADWDKMEVRR